MTMMRFTAVALLGALLGAPLGACVDPRPRADDACVTWKAEVGPRLATACASCHGGATPAAGYDLTTYNGALGPGTDAVANAIAGDPASLIVTAIDPARATEPHRDHAELHALVRSWVTTCAVAYVDSPLHPGGVLDPSSADFHGLELEQRGWDFALCARCHGDDFAGTPAGPSCTTCHVEGPTACDTCHPARPTSGAHATHLATGVGCASCHQVPAVWNQEGHLRRGDAIDPAPAEVAMSGLAAVTAEPADRSGPPTYDPATGTCAQVYCHGDVLGPTGAAAARPVWTADPPGPAACSSCHGAPPPSHARARCAECHPGGGQHLNGTMDIGVGAPGCSGCHGAPGSAAPPRDLDGDTLTTALGVGAHQAHLTGAHRLAAPIACVTCHLVPATVTAVGHLDSEDPAEVVAALGWDRSTATCATAWCHGPARPVWTTTDGAYCGSCHGLPPPGAPHVASMPLTACVTCHPRTVDRFGNILITDGPGGPVSTHLDGVANAP